MAGLCLLFFGARDRSQLTVYDFEPKLRVHFFLPPPFFGVLISVDRPYPVISVKC